MTDSSRRTQSNPDTISTISIDKMLGLNTVSPVGSFGQPNRLDNVYLDRRGGYTTAPGFIAAANFPGRTISSIEPLSDVNIMVAQFSGAPVGKSSFAAFNVDTGYVAFQTDTAYANLASYKSGFVVSWNYGAADDGIIIYQSSYASVGGFIRPVITEHHIVKAAQPTGTVVESGGYGTAPVNNGPDYTYAEGSRLGFEYLKTNFIFIYIQPYVQGSEPVGTTLNPTPPRPNMIYPLIYRVDPTPNGINKEYKITLNNPNKYKVYAFAEIGPQKRPVEEPVGGAYYVTRDNGVAITRGKYVTMPVTIGKEVAYHKMVALNAGKLGATPPQNVPSGYGSTYVDGEVQFMNVQGVNGRAVTMAYPEWSARIGGAPVGYLKPGLEQPEVEQIYGDFGECLVVQNGNDTEIYRSAATVQSGFTPSSFFPLGKITATHLGRTWVVPDANYSVIVNDSAITPQNPGAAYTVALPAWETAITRQTVYYSEPDELSNFQERFIVLPMNKSINVVAMYSIGQNLLFLGDADAVVLTGDSEANFYAKAIDIPGAYSQALTIVIDGILYYRGVGGIYRMNGGQAERISDEVANLIPAVPSFFDSVSRDQTHIIFQIGANTALVYDTVGNGWTTLSFDAFSFVSAGIAAISYKGGTVYKMNGPSDRVGKVGYSDMDAGDRNYRKRVMSASGYFENSGQPTASVDFVVNTHNEGAGTATPGHSHLVDQSSKLLRWRTRNQIGYAFDFTITLNPVAGAITMKPGLAIEVYKDNVIRKGYG